MKLRHNKQISARLILALIIIIAAIFRLYDLSRIPYGFHFDEAQAAYNGFLISEHLKNIHGEYLPRDIDYFGDYRPAMHSYIIALPIKFFGNTETSARLPAAIFGIYSVILTYLLTDKILKNKNIALIAAGMLAISPFHIIFSRATSDAIIEMSFVLTSMYFLYDYFSNRNVIKLLFVYLLWVASFFTYQISRMLIPIFVVLFLASQSLKEANLFFKVREFFILLTLILFIIFPLLYHLKANNAMGRFNQVSTFSNPEVQRSLNQQITEAGTIGIKPNLIRVFHNKIVAYSYNIAKRHISFYSPQTLLFDDIRPIRYKITNIGLVNPLEYLFAIAGLYFFTRKKIRELIFVILALAVAPLPSAITFEDFPNFHRAIYLLPFLQILAAFGIYMYIKCIKYKKSFILLSAIIATWFSGFFVMQYFVLSPLHEPFHRNFENREISNYLNDKKNEYRKIVITEKTGVYIYYLYFNTLDVFNIQVNKNGKYFNGDYQIENIFFSKNICINHVDSILSDYDLVINLNECKPLWFSVKDKEFKLSDGSLAAVAYKVDHEKVISYRNSNTALLECITKGINSKVQCMESYPEKLPNEH